MTDSPPEKKGGAAQEPGPLLPICPQCLVSSDYDCRESGCPGSAGFVPHAVALASLKTCRAMGKRIGELEAIVLAVSDFLNGNSSWDECSHVNCLVAQETARIRGKKKEGRADG